MKRRHFLTAATGALGAATLPAIEPIKRKGKSRMMLGLAAYSFRQNMKWMKDKENKVTEGKPAWDILDFIDYCADQGCPGAELTSYFFPPDAEENYMLGVKRHAYLRGVNICGSAIGNTFTHPPGEARDKEMSYTLGWIEKAAQMGAPHIRVFAGAIQKGSTQEEAEKNCIENYKTALEAAARYGVILGLENHGGIVAEPDAILRIIKAVDSPWAGINWDSGNYHTADPYADLAKIAPYAVNVQLKMKVHPKDEKDKEGQPSDIPRVLQILRDANYQGWFTLEYEDKEDPFVAVPRILQQLKPMLA
jgi:sugar phosphate isomerase/epimerase